MPQGSEPEDIQTILSRFHTWAGKNPGNGKNVPADPGGVREIGYEEAMRNYRQRHKTHPRRVAANAAAAISQASTAPSTPAQPASSIREEPPQAPVPVTLAPDLDVHFSAPAPPVPEPAALARRIPAYETTPVPRPRNEKKAARAKSAAAPKKVNIQAQPPAVAPAQPVHALPKATVSRKPKSRRAATAKKSVALAVRPPVAPPKKLAFKKVLAKTVSGAQAHAPAPRKSAPPPDRNRRITTRFSDAEQRRLERAAAQSGLTLSAWLRQCALLAEAATTPPPAPPSHAKSARRALPPPPPAPTLFSTPAPSGVGSWLTLLRQRFLSSPARFSERA